MWKGFYSLLRKDFKLMLSSKFFLLALGSLILYSCYINFIYVDLDQEVYPVYLYDPSGNKAMASSEIMKVDSLEQLKASSYDGHAVGIDISGAVPKVIMVSSGVLSLDQYRSAYALSLLHPGDIGKAEIIGTDNKEMKSRREITTEFLFFELTAVGFLGLASMLFKEKQMGIIRVHGILPVSKTAFILSKLILFLAADLGFSTLFTLINLGVLAGMNVLPAVMLQTSILSLIMALAGFLCAVLLRDFKQFSLLYLVLAVFVSTPVFLAGQTGIVWDWIIYHPMYHLFMALKNAYSGIVEIGVFHYSICVLSIILLFLLVRYVLTREMAKEG